MQEPNTIMDRYRQLPRAMQWATLAAIGLVLFLIWDNFVNPLIATVDKDADQIEARIAEIRSTETAAKKLQRNTTRELVTSLGPVQAPLPIEKGLDQFNQVVDDVMQRNGAIHWTRNSRPGSKLPKTALMELTGGIKRVDRLTGELKFDATPSAAMAIISELESSPNIESIDSVRIIRDTGGKVKVQLSLEAWMLSSETAKGGTV